MNDKEAHIAQATGPMDYAIRKLGGDVSLAELEAEAKRAIKEGLFPSKREVEIAKSVGIDGAEKREHVTDDAERGYQTYEELSKKMAEIIRKNNELLGIPEATTEFTVGYLNPETGKWEGGMSEEELKKQYEGLTIGVFDPLTKTWQGGDPEAVKKLDPGQAKPWKPLR
jgi:hypothetical protein